MPDGIQVHAALDAMERLQTSVRRLVKVRDETTRVTEQAEPTVPTYTDSDFGRVVGVTVQTPKADVLAALKVVEVGLQIEARQALDDVRAYVNEGW